MLFKIPCRQPNPTINNDDKYVFIYFHKYEGHKLKMSKTFKFVKISMKIFNLVPNIYIIGKTMIWGENIDLNAG